MSGVPASVDAASETTTVRPATGHRRRDIQGLRATAVAMVVVFHAGLPLPGGFVGVDVFFVISGFVITAMLMRERRKEGRVRLGRFYVRRFKRLAPALALTVGVVTIASLVLLSPFGGQQLASSTGMGAILLAANVVIARTTGDYFDTLAENNALLNLWSLSVEEQFYLVFPMVLLLGWFLATRQRRVVVGPAVVVAVVGGISLVMALAESTGITLRGVPEDLVGFYGPLTRVWEFSAGALLALGGSRLSASAPRVALPLSVAGAALLLVSLLAIDGTTPFPGSATLVPVVGTVLLLAAGSTDTAVTRALASRPMVWIGDRSYSIYLWHWPVIVFARLGWSDSVPVLVVAAVVSLVPAYASYRWVEQPVRMLQSTGAASFARLVAVTMVPPLVLAAALGYAAEHDLWNDSVRNLRTAVQSRHAANLKRCTQTTQWDAATCTWNGGAAGAPIYLVGDSNADHFSEALIDAATQLGRPLVVRVEDGCSYITGNSTLTDRDWRGRCERYPVETEEYLRGAKRGTVVVANAYGDFRERFDGPRSEPIDVTGDPAATPLFDRLTATVVPLQGVGHQVLLVQTVPHWGIGRSLDWQACTTLKVLWNGCEHTMPVEQSRARQGAIADGVAAVSQATGGGLLDLTEEICPDGICSGVARDGMVRYRDGVHITVPQSHALADDFAAAIQGLG